MYCDALPYFAGHSRKAMKMEHSSLRFLAAALLPGIFVFILLFMLHTPIPHTHSFWYGPLPRDDQPSDYSRLPRNADPSDSSRISRRSVHASKLSEWIHANLIGLRSVEDPGICNKDAACRGYLTGRAKESYTQCMARVKKYGHSKKAKDNGCHFIDGRRRGITALASFPGSGNTWVRTLLEKATGVCTGSYACDMSLRFAGFTGEGIQSSNVLVVKTHEAKPHWAEFNSAIVLVRNPLDAIVSDWNRYVANDFQHRTVHLGTHTQKAPREYFRDHPKWNGFVTRRASIWAEMIDNWVTNSAKHHKHRVLVVMYEDLKGNEESQVLRMVKFLNIGGSSDNKSEEQAVTRSSQNFTANFHRKHSNTEGTFDPYTSQQKAYVLNIITQMQKKLERHNLTSVLNVSRYLEKYNTKTFLGKLNENDNKART